MKKLIIFFALALWGFGEPLSTFTPNDKGSNINIIDLNVTPLSENANSTNFSKDAPGALSLTTKEGTFIKLSTGEGSGDTREEAIKAALIEAISKMKGFSSANSKEIINSYKMSSYNGQIDQKFSQKISQATKGRVDSYEVTNIFTEPNGKYGASVNAYKVLFSRNEKPNLVIFNASRFKALGDMLKQRLINDFSQSKKMNVLDRNDAKYYSAEKQLLESEDASSEDIYKLGNVFGADYMLVFNLRDIGGAVNNSSKLTTNKSTLSADVAVDYRLILFATREIKLANTMNVRVSLKDESVKTNEEALAKIAKALSADILNRLYPLWVASVENGEVLFEDKLAVGAVYECESKTSAQSSQVQITKSNSKLSSAKILSGQTSLGDECVLTLGGGGKDATYKLGTNGGVELGF